jgi:hypothetical protein
MQPDEHRQSAPAASINPLFFNRAFKDKHNIPAFHLPGRVAAVSASEPVSGQLLKTDVCNVEIANIRFPVIFP